MGFLLDGSPHWDIQQPLKAVQYGCLTEAFFSECADIMIPLLVWTAVEIWFVLTVSVLLSKLRRHNYSYMHIIHPGS